MTDVWRDFTEMERDRLNRVMTTIPPRTGEPAIKGKAMNRGNPNNSCMGAYGNTLNIKLTDQCNGTCPFCIEKGGKESRPKPVKDLIKAVNTINPDSVLLLGGEPTLHPNLIPFLKGIRKKGREVFLTTNGERLGDKKLVAQLAKLITAVNVSVHNYDQVQHRKLTGIDLDYDAVTRAIGVFRKHGVQIRINTLLLKGHLDTAIKCSAMACLASGKFKADWIRFSEVQSFPSMFVDAKDVFGTWIKTDNPFVDGCEQEIAIPGGNIRTTVKMTCGLVNPLKKKPSTKDEMKRATVLYPDAVVSKGWISNGDSCHGTSDGCHGRSSGGGGGCGGGGGGCG
jgi:hypothetical protein